MCEHRPNALTTRMKRDYSTYLSWHFIHHSVICQSPVSASSAKKRSSNHSPSLGLNEPQQELKYTCCYLWWHFPWAVRELMPYLCAIKCTVGFSSMWHTSQAGVCMYRKWDINGTKNTWTKDSRHTARALYLTWSWALVLCLLSVCFLHYLCPIPVRTN